MAVAEYDFLFKLLLIGDSVPHAAPAPSRGPLLRLGPPHVRALASRAFSFALPTTRAPPHAPPTLACERIVGFAGAVNCQDIAWLVAAR